MNRRETNGHSVTIELPIYELVDINGTVVSVHHTALDAAKEAERLWPGQPQNELGGSAECRLGWDIQVR